MTADILQAISGTAWAFVHGLGLAAGIVLVFLATVALVLKFVR